MDVEFADVRVERDRRVVLEVPSLRIRGLRTTAILGPNGSGKTTLLRLIAGLERPVTGTVRVDGGPVRPREHISFVFQEQVFLRRTVRENLELGLRLRRVDRTQSQVRIATAAKLLGIAHILERRADHLSGGERRRASLARALCLRAPLVLLDEPLEGLDERTYSRLLDELPQLLAEFNATTLLVTHTRDEALRLAQDLVILVEGRVHAAGDKRDVAMNPLGPEVAEVLGYVVLVTGNRRVAVAPAALKAGPGDVQFSMIVDEVLDLVEYQEIAGRIGGARARVRLPNGCEPPQRGDRLIVHAERFSDVIERSGRA